jgi:hypothetical protein
MKFFFLAILLVLTAGCGCNGKNYYSSPTDALTLYNEVEVVNFSVSGSAFCSKCDTKRVTALQVEIVPADDPLTTLAMNIFGGPGPFNFKDLRYAKGATLNVYGRIYYGTGDSSLQASTDVEVPDDGETVSCTLNF